MKIAYFISPHGYGHATRSIAIMQALATHFSNKFSAKNSQIEFMIFSSLPEHLFTEAALSIQYHDVVTDIGFYQYDALREDIDATVEALQQLLPFQDDLLVRLASACRGCEFVLCDIAAMGILVAQKANIPSILLENFTWDWIYQPYTKNNSKLKVYADYLKACYVQADYHIQMQPYCEQNKQVDLIVSPVFRAVRTRKKDLFSGLSIGDKAVILITFGGITTSYDFLKRLADFPEYFFIIPAAGEYQQRENYLLLPAQHHYHHPDLINSSDLVICKTGYSTVSEIYHSGVPLAFVGRASFPESPIIEDFIREHLSGVKLGQQEFENGDWLPRLPELIQLQRKPKRTSNGADKIACFILELIG